MTVDEAIDRIAILDLFSRYQRTVNIQGPHGHVAQLFTEDGTFFGIEGPVQGRDNLIAFYSQTHSDERFAKFRGGVHIFGNPEITLDGDRGSAYSEMVLIRPGNPGEVLMMLAYVDELEKVGGQWLFRSRKLVRLTSPVAA